MQDPSGLLSCPVATTQEFVWALVHLHKGCLRCSESLLALRYGIPLLCQVARACNWGPFDIAASCQICINPYSFYFPAARLFLLVLSSNSNCTDWHIIPSLINWWLPPDYQVSLCWLAAQSSGPHLGTGHTGSEQRWSLATTTTTAGWPCSSSTHCSCPACPAQPGHSSDPSPEPGRACQRPLKAQVAAPLLPLNRPQTMPGARRPQSEKFPMWVPGPMSVSICTAGASSGRNSWLSDF